MMESVPMESVDVRGTPSQTQSTTVESIDVMASPNQTQSTTVESIDVMASPNQTQSTTMESIETRRKSSQTQSTTVESVDLQGTPSRTQSTAVEPADVMANPNEAQSTTTESIKTQRMSSQTQSTTVESTDARGTPSQTQSTTAENVDAMPNLSQTQSSTTESNMATPTMLGTQTQTQRRHANIAALSDEHLILHLSECSKPAACFQTLPQERQRNIWPTLPFPTQQRIPPPNQSTTTNGDGPMGESFRTMRPRAHENPFSPTLQVPPCPSNPPQSPSHSYEDMDFELDMHRNDGKILVDSPQEPQLEREEHMRRGDAPTDPRASSSQGW
jgi:hypothetical protein